ncbi:ABC transporter substrate-binding protein [bacterium]|nr:ABC transporter substrate-binding protein [bacterium]
MKNLFLVIISLIMFSSQTTWSASKKAEKIKVRIGWQIPWSIQGQLVQILKHTDILAKNGIEAEFIGKSAGPELNELAMAGQVDLILTADQPATVLFMKSADWRGIARLMYNRTTTYVPLKSKINNVQDLKKKQVGVPYGTAAQRIIVEAIENDKVTDVKFVNLGMLEHIPLIDRAKASDEKWGDFDALSGFDPIPAVLEANKKVKTIHKGKVCSMVVVNKNFIGKNKNLPKKFIKALTQAYVYYQKNTEKANKWFIEEAKITNTNPTVFEVAAEYEPNLKKNAKIRTKFSDEDFVIIQKAADFAAKNTKKNINIKDFVNNSYH